MLVLVAYASKHGATREIAERIAETLRAAGHAAEVLPVNDVRDPERYDAFVLGSAVFYGSWMKEATSFARRHRELLATRPTWLFSSGPLGAELLDAEGRDLREAAKPKQIDELVELLAPRGHRVFFGALRRDTFSFFERLVSSLPAGNELFQEGDFRDWEDIERWAQGVAAALTPSMAR